MITTAVIAFREFLEAFLLVGIFFGVNRKLNLGKQKEIVLATLFGIGFSLILPLAVFMFGNSLTNILTEKNADAVEGYFLSFSGFFLLYVIFSLHEFMKDGKKKTIFKVQEKMKQEIFDVSLFFTIIFFITREGFEIALLTATTSIFSLFTSNIEGLFIGFLGALSIGIISSFTYIKLPIKRIFSYTEYVIMVIGAAMVKNGITLLCENYLHVDLGKIFTLPLNFLPSKDTIFGHALNNLFGIEKGLGFVQVVIMVWYIGLVFILFKFQKVSVLQNVPHRNHSNNKSAK